VLFEVLDLIEKKRITGIDLGELSSFLLSQPYFEIRSVDWKLWETAQTFGKGMELHDRMLAALAKQEGAKVITKDEEIRGLKEIETVW
ncbi:MAG: PIN domain-containing protein, partial [Candidatus Cloacimonetes bacterium]|nr:PIN domain-containing protein [Candidatus Cloacimonadota bacterium]